MNKTRARNKRRREEDEEAHSEKRKYLDAGHRVTHKAKPHTKFSLSLAELAGDENLEDLLPGFIHGGTGGVTDMERLMITSPILHEARNQKFRLYSVMKIEIEDTLALLELPLELQQRALRPILNKLDCERKCPLIQDVGHWTQIVEIRETKEGKKNLYRTVRKFAEILAKSTDSVHSCVVLQTYSHLIDFNSKNDVVCFCNPPDWLKNKHGSRRTPSFSRNEPVK